MHSIRLFDLVQQRQRSFVPILKTSIYDVIECKIYILPLDIEYMCIAKDIILEQNINHIIAFELII